MDQNLLDIIKNFANSGQDFVVGKRNTIKLFDYQSTKIIVKLIGYEIGIKETVF